MNVGEQPLLVILVALVAGIAIGRIWSGRFWANPSERRRSGPASIHYILGLDFLASRQNRSRCFRAHSRRPGEHGGDRDLSDSRKSAPRERSDRASDSNPPKHSAPAEYLGQRAGTCPLVPRHGFQEGRLPQPSDGYFPKSRRARAVQCLRPPEPHQDPRRGARLGTGIEHGGEAQPSNWQLRFHSPGVFVRPDRPSRVAG